MLLTDKPIYQRVYALVQDHNQAQGHAGNLINKNRYSMLRAVTELSITEARRAVASPAWADSDQLPTVYTNRRELATLVGCGERTVYNCLNVLESAGLVQKQLHGRQNDFELVLHPWLIFGDNFPRPTVRPLPKPGKSREEGENLSPQNQIPPSDNRQNLPPISSLVSRESFIISSNSGVNFVEKWARSHFLAPETQNSRVVDQSGRYERKDSGTRPEKADKLAENQQIKSVGQLLAKMSGASHRQAHADINDKDDGRAGNEPEVRSPAPAHPRQKTAPSRVDNFHQVQELKKDLTRQFWRQAKETLWPNDYIADDSDYERRLLNLIWTEVFGSWEGQHTANQVSILYFTRISQLESAQAYALKHDWTGFLPPPLYFSRKQYLEEKRNNKRGSFWWTYEWVKQADSKRKEKIKADQLARAVRSMVAGKAPRGVKDGRDFDRLRLYQYWRHRLGKLGDARLLDAFDEKISVLIPQ